MLACNPTYLNSGSSSPKSVRVTAVSKTSVGLAGGKCNLTFGSPRQWNNCTPPTPCTHACHRTCQGTLETFAGCAGTCDWAAWCPDRTQLCTLSSPAYETSIHRHPALLPAQSVPTMGCTSHSRRAAWWDVVYCALAVDGWCGEELLSVTIE